MTAYRDVASFGKRVEHDIISKMLKEDLDVYTPVIDDHGVDMVVKNSKDVFCEVQVKALSAIKNRAPLFAAIQHPTTPIPNYWFVFCEEPQGRMWILSSQEFIQECSRNKSGRNVGKCSIYLGRKCNRYLAQNFDRIKN